ncbi:MAG: lipase family protein [Cyanobacteria bacterium P01_A01_bin.68]
MVGRFGKKVGNIGKNVVGKAADKVGDITGGTIDKALDSKFAELFKKQSDVLLTQDYFDRFYFDTIAKNYSPYNAYSLGLASFLAYSVTGEGGKDVSGELELNKEALKNFLCKEDQQEQQTEAIFAKLDNWLSNFSDRNFITGTDTNLIQLSAKKGITSTITNSQAIVLRNEEIIIVAFRGSQELGDFFTDAQFIHSREFPGGYGVHNGFCEALMSIWSEVWEQIKPEVRGGRTLWFTGHSLGAGLANLATAMCLFEEEYSKNPPNGMYTYGQPKVGDENFVSAFNEKFKEQTFRFVNNNDIVPFLSFGPSDFDVKLPNVFKFIPKFDKTLINILFVLDYYHCGNFKLFDSEGTLQDESFGIADKWVDRASGYLNNFLKLDPGSLNLSLSLNPLDVMKSLIGRAIDRIDCIGDHFMSQYIVNLKTHLDKWERENPDSVQKSCELTPESVKRFFDNARKNSDGERTFAMDLGTDTDLNNLPNNVKQAYDFYKENVEDADFGCAGVYEIIINNSPVYAVAIITDGDDGYLEIYSKSGEEITCGKNDSETINWSDRATTRADLIYN